MVDVDWVEYSFYPHNHFHFFHPKAKVAIVAFVSDREHNAQVVLAVFMSNGEPCGPIT